MDNPFTKYLEDVPWDNSLKLSNGKTVHGLEQLPMIIKFSDDEVFYSHVNDQKNDFANWIKDVIGYPELAGKLSNINKKEEFLTFMEKAISDIKTDMRNYKPPEPKPEPVSVQVSSPAVAPAVVIAPVVVPSDSITPVVSVPTPASVVAPPITVPPIVRVSTSSSGALVSESQFLDTISSGSPIAAPVVTASPPTSITPVALTAPVSVAPVVSPASVAVVSVPVSAVPVSSPTQIEPAVSIPVSPGFPTSTAAPAVETTVPEETYDFEEIFKVLLAELEQEAFTWDTQTS